ncbi:hypothetical protein F2Q68_00015914 [Brassica cretica]|uniref:C2 domain-containing protein n=2 Tax=Brassica cretica TaxID=69181 RepID=A0ABQ7EWY9_BRACR|nr:hypothetical protein F2Q68_00015914 [Brassica cretica]KAF3607785.1 hypothetical protein DY000_02048462 [Brassica cretica]
MEATEERLVVYDVDVLDYQSILVSLKTSNAVFCLLDSPEGYDFAEGMVEFIGLLEVAVKKDSLWILKAIVHKLQKTVVNCNLNPVWNQELMLSVPDSYGPVKLQVYDYDTFSAGDIMGEAQLDIQPLITSAMVFGDPEMFGDMQIGKWLKLHDNPPIDDSII